MIASLAGLRDRFVFAGQAVRSLNQVGAFVPTTGAVARAVVEPLRAIEAPRRVLEVGAGTGALTGAICSALGPGDRLFVNELNTEFVRVLRERFESVQGPELTIVPGDIVDVLTTELASGSRYDAVVSSLPLMNLASDTVQRIFSLYLDALRPGGVVSFYDYFGKEVRVFLGGAAERKRVREVLAVQRSFLERFEYERRVVPWSIPPATVHHLKKP